MFHGESWKPIYFGVKRSKVKVTSCKKLLALGLCECWLLVVAYVMLLTV